MRHNTPITDHEYVLGEQQYLISQTDLDSHIIYANPAFIEVSGFDWNELVGAPHNMIRHPDMPPEAFADFWHTIQQGRTWTGIVKNRRKNGDFYWVHATAMPIVQSGETVGYASIRRRATDDEKTQATRIYARLRAGAKPRAHLASGVIREHRLRARLARLRQLPIGFRVGALSALGVIGAVVTGLVGLNAINDLAAVVDPSANPALAARIDRLHDRSVLWLLSAAGVLTLLLAGWGWTLGRQLTQSLANALTLSRQIAAGNLTAELDARRDDELGRLMSSLNVMRASLINIVEDVKGGINILTPAATGIAQGNERLSERTENQAASLEQTSSVMEELTATASQTGDKTSSASELAAKASTTATRGDEQIGAVVDDMQQIDTSAIEISKIVSIIDDIAFQTNLLALNASVEAARAGENGRGFAVVATEVRALAERSARSAQQIKTLIQSSNQRIHAGVQAVEQTRETIASIVKTVREASELMADVSVAAVEQHRGISQINDAVTQMNDTTQQNAVLVEESAASARALSSQARDLEKSIAIFRTAKGKLGLSETATFPAGPA